LVLELDQSNKIVNLNRETEGEGGGRQVVTMKDLMKKPAVLARTADRDILILSCMNCSAERGGTFKLKYLYNGMTMKYKSIELAFSVASNSRRWQLHAKNHKKKFVVVEWLRLVPRMIFGQLVGIKKILVNE